VHGPERIDRRPAEIFVVPGVHSRLVRRLPRPVCERAQGLFRSPVTLPAEIGWVKEGDVDILDVGGRKPVVSRAPNDVANRARAYPCLGQAAAPYDGQCRHEPVVTLQHAGERARGCWLDTRTVVPVLGHCARRDIGVIRGADGITVEGMQTMVPAGSDKIWVEDSGGDGPVLLLLHEGVADARMWDPVWPALTASCRAIRYDVRGYNRSPAATENYTLLADALTVLDHVGVTAAHVVGCSMGGGTAIELALTEPDRVTSLVLLCPGIPGYVYPEDPAVEARFDEAAAAGDTEGLVRLGLEQWGRSGDDPQVTELMRAAMRAWENEEHFQQRGEPVYDRLGELRVPVVLLVGDQDNPGLIASNEAAAERIAGCELIRMPGVDHYPTMRAPSLVTETILRHATRPH
jgi:3-oxoadipate enol-lactonase